MDRPAGVVILEPNPGGHRLSYVRLIAEAALADGRPCSVLLSSDAVVSEEFRVHLQPLTSRGLTILIHPDLSPTAPGRVRVQVLRSVARDARAHRAKPVTLVIPDGDRLLVWLALTFGWAGTELRLLVMRRPHLLFGRPASRFRSVAKAASMLLAACRGVKVFVLSGPTASERQRGLVRVVPDPVVIAAHARDRERIRLALDLPAHTTLVGMVGALDVRKNPQLVLAAVALIVAEDGGGAQLVFAGKVDRGVVGVVDEGVAQGLVARVDSRYMSDRELDEYVAACDVIALLYANEGPSGMLGKAAAIGTPVVAAGSRWLRRETLASGAGEATTLDAQSVARAIRLALGSQPPSFVPPEVPRLGQLMVGVRGSTSE